MTRLHKWAGLILGIQIILWFGSGLFMTFFDIDTVRGDLVASRKNYPLTIESPVSVETAGAHYTGGELQSAKLRSVVGDNVWEMKGTAGTIYVDAQNGELWPGVSEGQVRSAAELYYIGDGAIASVNKLDVAPLDYRGAVPVWQLKYDDREQTRLYISPHTGELLKTRTRLWRAFDFMWMLHIMGYPDRDNINSWWLILASFAGFLFSLTGVALIIHRIILRPKPHKFKN